MRCPADSFGLGPWSIGPSASGRFRLRAPNPPKSPRGVRGHLEQPTPGARGPRGAVPQQPGDAQARAPGESARGKPEKQPGGKMAAVRPWLNAFWLVGECTTPFRTYFSGWIGMFTEGTIWLLTHGIGKRTRSRSNWCKLLPFLFWLGGFQTTK